MSVLVDGLNQKASFVGDISAQQEGTKVLSEKEFKEKEKNRKHCVLLDQNGNPTVNDFPDLMSTMYTTTVELCHTIGNLLRPIFNDYYGAKIEIVQNRGIIVSIFFSPNGPAPQGKYNAIESILDEGNSSEAIIKRMNHMSAFGYSSTLRISKDADEILRDLIPNGAINFKNGKVDWNKVVKEGTVREANGFAYNQTKTYLQVMVDANKLMKCLFGNELENDGGTMEYMINVGNPINPAPDAFGNITSNLWQLFVIRCNSKDVQDMAASMGLIFGGNDLNIIT